MLHLIFYALMLHIFWNIRYICIHMHTGQSEAVMQLCNAGLLQQSRKSPYHSIIKLQFIGQKLSSIFRCKQ